MSNGIPQSDDLISAFHDGELAGHDRKAAEQLLEESADSRAELEDYRALSELLRELPTVAAPDGLRSAVMSSIRDLSPAPAAAPTTAARARGRWRFRIGLIATGLTAAAALLVMLVRSNQVENATLVTSVDTDAASATPMSASDFSVGSSDGSVAAGSLDALGGSGGVTTAGLAARPPDGFSIGDVYTYLEQTPDGDVMVVKAVVVDVQQVASQLQVLLSQIEIPTVSVAMNDESYGRARGGAFSGGARFADVEQEVALYVETDPTRMSAALKSLGNEDEILSWQYAGVLDESQPAAQLGARSYFFSEVPALGMTAEEPADTVRELDLEPAAPREPTPAARGSVIDRPFRRAAEEAAEKEIMPEALTPSAPLQQKTDTLGLAKNELEEHRESAQVVDIKNGYQTILNLPRQELEQQLMSNASAPQPEPGAGRLEDRYDDGVPQRDSKLVEGAMKDADGAFKKQLESLELRQETKSGEAAAGQQQSSQSRRLRLLVVLEPEPAAAGKATKAKADPPPAAPVEAAPPARKKG